MNCINCRKEMDFINGYCLPGSNYDTVVEWCPNCGTLIRYYDNKNPVYDYWRVPQVSKKDKGE